MEKLRKKFEQALKDFNVPGLALAAVKDGEVIVAEGFGYRDLEAKRPVTADTLFQMGSTTKAMTSTVLGMLVDEGKLEWDKPLRNYLPEFRLSDPVISDRVTPRDLVTHRTGIPKHGLVALNTIDTSREELLKRFQYLELTADLREKYQYSNLMFMTAGYLAGVIEKKRWEDVVQERIFTPLDMDRSNFSISQTKKDSNFANPYREDEYHQIEEMQFADISMTAPAGSLSSSVREMAHWLQFNLNQGLHGNDQLIGISTLRDIHSAHISTGYIPGRKEFSEVNYGMGWMLDHYRGHRRVWHGGLVNGFRASVNLLPDENIGIVVVNNGNSELTASSSLSLMDNLLGLEPIDWFTEAKLEREATLSALPNDRRKKEGTRVPDTKPPHPISAYTGNYKHPGYGTLIVVNKSGALQMSLSGREFDLEHWHFSVWRGLKNTDGKLSFTNVKFLFHENFDGEICSVEVPLEPKTKPIKFEKQPDPILYDSSYLKCLTGTYMTVTKAPIKVEQIGNTIRLASSGGGPSRLTPHVSGRFIVDEAQAVSLEFVMGDDAVPEKILIHDQMYVREAFRSI